MTEAVLISLITLICGGSNSSSNGYSAVNGSRIKEERIACYEQLANCGITLNGIMSLQDFTKKCVKK